MIVLSLLVLVSTFLALLALGYSIQAHALEKQFLLVPAREPKPRRPPLHAKAERATFRR